VGANRFSGLFDSQISTPTILLPLCWFELDACGWCGPTSRNSKQRLHTSRGERKEGKRVLSAMLVLRPFIIVAALFCGIRPSLTLNGDPAKLTFNTYRGWKAFEVITQGDTNGQGYILPGELDGIGAYLVLEDDSNNTVRVLVNHETGRACDTANNATVTEVNLDLAMFRQALQNMLTTAGTLGGVDNFVRSFRRAYDTIIDETGTIIEAPDPRFKLFCSSQAYGPDTFGPGKGFRDQVYLFGEEKKEPPYGRLFVIENKERKLYQVSGAVGDASGLQGGNPGMMQDSFENVALIRTFEQNYVCFLMSMDGGSKTLKLYVGQKNKGKDGSPNTEDFMARNGLAFGSWFYLQGVLPTTQGETMEGLFSASIDGAMLADHYEDIDTNPLNPTQVVLGEEQNGIYVLDFSLSFSATNGLFQPNNSAFSVTMVLNDKNAPLREVDNVLWTESNLIYITCDGTNAGIWEMKPDATDLVEIAASKDTSADSNPSGTVDISKFVGYQPSSILLATTMNCGSSMAVLINPDAELLPTKAPSPVPDAAQDSRSPTLSPAVGTGFQSLVSKTEFERSFWILAVMMMMG